MQPAVALVGLAIAYSPSYVGPLLRSAGAGGASGPRSVLVWNWLAVGALLVFMARVERRSLASIGLVRPSRADLGWALAFFAISTAASALLTALRPPAPSAGLAAVLALPLPVLIGLILTTASTEEILFRGYPFERLKEWTGSVWLALAISFACFVLPHVRFLGPDWLLYNGVGAVLAFALYAWRRNLWACMAMHGLGNALLLPPATSAA